MRCLQSAADKYSPDTVTGQLECPVHGEEDGAVQHAWLMVPPGVKLSSKEQKAMKREYLASTDSRLTTSTISVMPNPPPRLGQTTLYSKNRGVTRILDLVGHM